MENKQPVIIEYLGEPTIIELMYLADDIRKGNPKLVFKHGDKDKYHIPESMKGVSTKIEVFDDEDLNTCIGQIGYMLNEKKYWVSNQNISNGRYYYRANGEIKQSIHRKNIVKIGKDTIKPLTFKQIMLNNEQSFKGNVNALHQAMYWDLQKETKGAFDVVYEEMLSLYKDGYKPKTKIFDDVMQYLVLEQEKINKYKDYDPDAYFVWIKDKEVQFKRKKDIDPPTIVASKDDLPDEIKGKMFVLDITDSRSFIEDVGLKQTDNAYWVIA